MACWEWVVVGKVRRGCVVVGMIIGMAPALAVMEGVGVVGGGVVEVVVLVVVGCVVVVRACEVVVVWVVALWAAGEYRGSGDGGSCRDRSVAREWVVVGIVRRGWVVVGMISGAGVGVWLGICGVVVVEWAGIVRK